jgi:hypothetical protein
MTYMRRQLTTLIATLVAGACCIRSAEFPKTASLMLFVDASQSTNKMKVLELASTVLHGARPGLKIEIYSIGSSGEIPAPIVREQRTAKSYASEQQLNAWIKRLAGAMAEKRYQQTCILNLFEFAAGQLRANPLKPGTRADIVFITDMIEDCKSTPFGVPVRLSTASLKGNMKAAAGFPQGKVDLGGQRVTFILPPSDEASSGPRRTDLEMFWRTFLTRCTAADAVAPEIIVSASSVPNHLGRR